MKRTLLTALTLLTVGAPVLGAIDADTIWEIRQAGSQTNGGGVRWLSLVNATYQWMLSASGTGEYYCELAAGGDPSLTEPHSVTLDGNYNLAAVGTLGSLAVERWAWGDNDTLGYNTLYVRLAADRDPDLWFNWGKPGYVSMVYGGGTDYSQQNAAQLSLADLATDGAGTGLSSVTGGFAADMLWNIIYLVDGGATEGWYQITAVASANACTIDRSAGAGKTGVTGNVGGAWKIGGSKDATFYNSGCVVAGNRFYWRKGTYALGATPTAVNGTGQLPIIYLGYTAVRGDTCLGTDRPLLTQGWNVYMQFGSSTHVSNLRVEGDGDNAQNCVIRYAGTNVFINVKATMTSNFAGKSCFYAASSAADDRLFGCEAINQAALNPAWPNACFLMSQGTAVACHAVGALYGFEGQESTDFVQCVAENSQYGFYGISSFCAVNCGAYNCTAGYAVNNSTIQPAFVNCIAKSCGSDFYNAAANELVSVVTLNNVGDGATGFNKVRNWFNNQPATDAGLADPANQDWRVDSADTAVYERGTDLQTYTAIRTH